MSGVLAVCPKCDRWCFGSGSHEFFGVNANLYDCFECGLFGWNNDTNSEEPLRDWQVQRAKEWGAVEEL